MPKLRIGSLAALLILGYAIASITLARDLSTPNPEPQNPPTATAKTSEKSKKSIVDYAADDSYKSPSDPDSVIRLKGNVVFHHNGAFIECDSAMRYGDYNMEGFGNVIIYKDSTYIYGDRISYRGHTDIASVYSPIVKLMRGDATLYAYDMVEFNTKSTIGNFTNGGVILQRDNTMESDRGTYYGDSSEIRFVGHVAMKNDNYKIRTDSVSYNLDTEVVTFLAQAYIWDKDRDFLTAPHGKYLRSEQTYYFTGDAYAMTPSQEMWADTMSYRSLEKEAVMYTNIQITDTTQKTLAFGDYGYYNDSLKRGMLTRTPSVISYQEPTKDTTTLGDTTNVAPLNPLPATDSLTESATAAIDSIAPIATAAPRDTLPVSTTGIVSVADSLATGAHNISDTMLMPPKPKTPPVPDSTFIRGDSIFFDSFAKGLSKTMGKPQQEDTTATDDSSSADSTATGTLLKSDSLARDSASIIGSPLAADSLQSDSTNIVSEPITDQPHSTEAPPAEPPAEEIVAISETITEEPRKSHESEKIRPSRTDTKRDKRKRAKDYAADSTTMSIKVADSVEITVNDNATTSDSLSSRSSITANTSQLTDTLSASDTMSAADVDNLPTIPTDSLAPPTSDSLFRPTADKGADSLERVIRTYYNVKIFRRDMQSVCDSLISFSVDSTMSMFGRPLLWNENSQIAADRIDLYTKNEELDYADLIGTPFVTQQVASTIKWDTIRYNQATGRTLKVWFRDNDVHKAQFTGNVRNFYYMENSKNRVQQFAVIDCADMIMEFRQQSPSRMIWMGSPTWKFFPIKKIPTDQEQRLPDFTWEPDKRPRSRFEITTRTIRPSERARAERFAQPVFPIEQRLRELREKLVKEGTWRDRSEPIQSTMDRFLGGDLLY